MPTLRFSIGTGVTSTPSKSTWPPLSGDSSPAMMRRVVVLPQPDGPSSTIVSPAAISRSIGSNARVPSSNVLPQRFTWIGIPLINSCRRSMLLCRSRKIDGLRRPLQRYQQRDDDDEKDQRVRGPDFEPQRRVGIGEPDRQRRRQGRVQQQGHVELADRQRYDHQRARDDAGSTIGQYDAKESLSEIGTEAACALFE